MNKNIDNKILKHNQKTLIKLQKKISRNKIKLQVLKLELQKIQHKITELEDETAQCGINVVKLEDELGIKTI